MAGIFKHLFGGKSADENRALSVLKTDVHSHLIPGIDDGSPDMATSLEMIRGLMGLGYTRFVTTPHIMSDAYPNTPEIILGGLEKLRAALEVEQLDVEVDAAAEYYLDEFFTENLDKGNLLTFGGDKQYLLFETSYIARPLSLSDTIFRLQSLSFTPVMAHPERYQFFWKEGGIDEVRILCNRGVKMQVNLSSFTGRQGRRAGALAREMAKEGMIDFLGSDLHRPSQVATVGKAAAASRELRHLLQNATLLNQEL